MADARASVDDGDEGQKGEYGTLFEASVGLERLGHMRKKIIKSCDGRSFRTVWTSQYDRVVTEKKVRMGGIGDERIKHGPRTASS